MILGDSLSVMASLAERERCGARCNAFISIAYGINSIPLQVSTQSRT